MTHHTRREWLAISAASIAAVSARAEDKTVPRIPFGFSLYGMKSLKVADALKACKEIGYDGVELALMPGYPTDPAKLTAWDRLMLRTQLADNGLSLLGMMENLSEPAADAARQKDLDRLKAAFDLWNDLLPRTTPLVETILGGKPADWEKTKDALADRLAAWAEVAAKAKAVIAIKPHVSNALHTIDAALWLLKKVNSPAIRLAFDYSHFALRNVPLDTAVDALLPHAAFIHVKDAKGSPEKVEFLLPGDGDTDYPEYFKLLKKSKYVGPVVVEVSGMVFNKPGYDPIAAAKRCYTNLLPAFEKSGLRSI